MPLLFSVSNFLAFWTSARILLSSRISRPRAFSSRFMKGFMIMATFLYFLLSMAVQGISHVHIIRCVYSSTSDQLHYCGNEQNQHAYEGVLDKLGAESSRKENVAVFSVLV